MRDSESPQGDSSSPASGTPPGPIVEWQPTGDAAGAAPNTPDGEAPPVRLWLPRDVGIASFLLGFPGGFGLLARNAWRIGRRRSAYLHLVAGAGILLLILFLPIPRALGFAVNFGIAYALYSLAKGQVAVVTGRGGRVERAPGLAGIATFLGGWVAVAAPAFVLATVLGAFGGTISPGTMEFGTSGQGCSVDAAKTTTAASGPVHYVAYLSRQVRSGETINLALSEQTKGHLEDDSLPVDSAADCVSGTIPGGTLPAGTYTFEFTVGAERVALGSVVLTP